MNDIFNDTFSNEAQPTIANPLLAAPLHLSCISPFSTKNNTSEYQAVMNYLKNKCKSIVGISNTWCIFAA